MPYNGPYFPTVTYEDNMCVKTSLRLLVRAEHLLCNLPSRAQYAVLVKKLKISKIFCVIGLSMGGQQVCTSDDAL